MDVRKRRAGSAPARAGLSADDANSVINFPGGGAKISSLSELCLEALRSPRPDKPDDDSTSGEDVGSTGEVIARSVCRSG